MASALGINPLFKILLECFESILDTPLSALPKEHLFRSGWDDVRQDPYVKCEGVL